MHDNGRRLLRHPIFGHIADVLSRASDVGEEQKGKQNDSKWWNLGLMKMMSLADVVQWRRNGFLYRLHPFTHQTKLNDRVAV